MRCGSTLYALAIALQAMGRSLEVQLQELARTHGVAQVELRRSERRRRTISAFRENGTLIIAAPARISAAELLEAASDLLRRVLAKERAHSTDSALEARARTLAAQYLPANLPTPASVRWTNARSTWGSCVSADRTIVISRALMGMPDWVIDYVLVHELAHLLESNHGPRFYSLVSAYPQWEQARAFLDGVSWQARHAQSVPATDLVDGGASNSHDSAVNPDTPESEEEHPRPPAVPDQIPRNNIERPADLFDM